MTTTVRAIYEEGVLKLRRLLPLRPQSEVLVTIEMPPGPAVSVSDTADVAVTWPDISARLKGLYGEKTLPENAVLTARSDERY